MAIHPIEFRYGTPEMKNIWESENKLQRMLDVESALAQAEGKLGIIPKEVADEIASKANTKYVKLKRKFWRTAAASRLLPNPFRRTRP